MRSAIKIKLVQHAFQEGLLLGCYGAGNSGTKLTSFF
jgi:hypothetical protein